MQHHNYEMAFSRRIQTADRHSAAARDLADRKELIAKYVPPETQAVHAQAVAELKARHLAANILPVGAKAPEFELQDHDGKIVSSAELLANGLARALLHSRAMVPLLCGTDGGDESHRSRRSSSAGASLVAISPQTVKQSFFMHDQHKLRFPLLSDAGNKVARQFGLTYRVPAEQEAIYRRAFVNLPFTNGDESWELPIPATYIVDRDGTILYASANEDYTERPEPAEIIRVLGASSP